MHGKEQAEDCATVLAAADGEAASVAVDDVLHAHRHAMQQALARSAIEHPGAFEGSVAGEMRPGEHVGVQPDRDRTLQRPERGPAISGISE